MGEVLRYLLIFIEVICSFLLIGVILIQRSKGSGLGMGFGQAMGEQFLGAQAGNVLTKTTVILSLVFFVNTMALAYIYSDRIRGGSIMEDYSDLQPVPVSSPALDQRFQQPEGEMLNPSAGTAPDATGVQPDPLAPPSGDSGMIPVQPVEPIVVDPPADAQPVEVQPIEVPPVTEDSGTPAPGAGN